MRLMVLTQVLDLDDPILGFAHGWMAALAKHVDRLIVAPLKAGRFDLPDNVEVRSLGKERGGSTVDRLRSFRRVVGGACREGDVDAILAHMVPRYAVYAAPFAKPRGVPLFLWYTHKGVDWSLRMAEPLIRRAYTASEKSFRLPSRKKVVTGHGIDTDWFTPPDNGASIDDPVEVVVVGRIAPAKDPLVLVEALGRLKSDGLTLRASFVGDTLLDEHDAYKRDVLRRISELGLGDDVTLAGAVPHSEVRRAFWRAPLFCTPSVTGSVDKTVLEAMACGRIPVTCNESFTDVFKEHASRLMFERGDAAGLAARLRELHDMPQAERAILASALRRLVVEEHNLDRLAARLVADMRGAIGAPAASG